MGPTIILDKSAIQSFSERELNALTKFYTLNVTPSLFQEIRKDLSKKSRDKNYATPVIHLANKLNPNNFKINIHYRNLIINELLGRTVPFGYRTIVPAEKEITREDGKRGVYIKQSAEEEAIERWREGIFTEEEMTIAQMERDELTGTNLEGYRKPYEKLKKKINPPITKDNLSMYIQVLFNNINRNFSPLEKFNYIEILMDMMKVPISVQNKIKDRWYALSSYDLMEFAKYLVFFDTLLQTFNIGLIFDMFGTRTTNLIDLEYLLYLPFCFVFCTGDKFQYQLSQYVDTKNQYILKAFDLKKELAHLADTIELNENKPDQLLFPPAGSLTAKIYEDYEKLGKTLPSDDLDFMTIERFISPYAPCPCGSGKKFKDCHLAQVQVEQP